METLGPLWIGPLHDSSFLNTALSKLSEMKGFFGTESRIEGLLSVVSEELNQPLFLSLNEMASFMKVGLPKLVSFRYLPRF